MGIGMVVVVAAKDAEKAVRLTNGKIIGKIVQGSRRVVLKEAVKRSAKK
jgi:phosphoribosylaminoimidazole (AIR) synthetase